MFVNNTLIKKEEDKRRQGWEEKGSEREKIIGYLCRKALISTSLEEKCFGILTLLQIDPD